MARNINQITLIGAITDRPELKYTPAGLAILEVKLAGNHRYDGERTAVFYHQVTVFGKPAEWFVEADHPVGTLIAVSGKLNYRAWENEDGERRSAVGITADMINVIDGAHHTLVKDKKGNERLERGLNHVIVSGNLTRDVEVRNTETGNTLAHGALAINESYKQGNEWLERTHFVDFTAWNTAGAPLEGAGKGTPVTLIGHFIIEGWQDKQGNWRITPKIIVERAEVGAKTGAGGRAAGKRPAAPTRPTRQEVVDEFPPEQELPF